MTLPPRLDGAVPLEPGGSHEIALAALTRRVADLEHRVNMMKVMVGLVLAAKVLFVVFFLYVLFGHGFMIRHEGPMRSAGEPIEYR